MAAEGGRIVEKLIATIPRNQLDELRVEIGEYRGHDFISIRTWTERHDSEEMVPTKKGITVKPERLPELITALQKAEKEAGDVFFCCWFAVKFGNGVLHQFLPESLISGRKFGRAWLRCTDGRLVKAGAGGP